MAELNNNTMVTERPETLCDSGAPLPRRTECAPVPGLVLDTQFAVLCDEGSNANNAAQVRAHFETDWFALAQELCVQPIQVGIIPQVDRTVSRVLAAHRVLARMDAPCPQGESCRGDGKHRKIFKCRECDFKGCAVCCDAHELEGHCVIEV